MATLTLDGFKKWLDLYGQASRDRDPQAAAELFSPDAQYFETPFDEPMIGRDAIYQYWSGAAQSLRDVQFSYQILAVKQNLGLARWQANFVPASLGARIALDGVLLAEFDDQGKCSLFREWWHRQEIDSTPISDL